MCIISFGDQPKGNGIDSFWSGFRFCPIEKGRLEIMCEMKRDAVNQKKEEKGLFRVKKFVAMVCGAAALVVNMPLTVFAASGTQAIIQPLENLKTLVIAIICAVGVIILAKNVMEFAQAYQQQDSSTMNSALKGIVAGIMMAGISTVLTFLGF